MTAHLEPESVDGRRRKGERRRRMLIDATMRVIERDGVAGVTQRAVAREAEMPPSAVMYYFPTVQELLHTALVACNDSYIRRLAEIDQHDDAEALRLLAREIATGAAGNRARTAAEYELCLLAGRQPAMRGEALRQRRALDSFTARFTTDPATQSGIAAAVDGLFLRTLSSEDPPGESEVLKILRRLTDGA